MTFTGTVDHVNAALATLAYQGDLDYNGADSLDVNVSDQGNTGSGGVLVDGGAVAINIAAVNDQPHVTLPGAQNAVEDTSLDIHGLSVSDVDSDDGGELAVTLTVQHGTLGLTDTTGLTFTGGTAPGDASLTFTGTVDHVNAALATLAYQGDLDYNGADSLDVNVSDQGNTGSGGVLVDGGAVAINIAAVNDQPHVILPGAQSAVEDTSLDIHGLSVSDVDSDDGGELAVTLTVQHGTLGLTDTTGLTFTGGTAPGDASLTFTGTVDHVNAALATLAYQGDLDYNGADSLDVNVSDQGNTGSGGVLVDSGAVAINIAAVNDQPHVTLPGAQSAVEDTSLDIHGLSVSDVDSDDGGELAVTLTVQHGTLGLTDTTGLTFTGGTAPGDASLTFTGTVDHVNAALATLAYQGDLDYNGADSLDVNVSDQGNTGSGGVLVDGGAVAINIAAVNDQPHVTLPGAQNAVEDTSLDIHGLSVSDVDSDDGGELAVTLTVQHGTLGLTDTTGLTFTGGTAPGDASLTFTGTVDHVNAALATLAYQSDLDYNGADSLDVNVSDQGNTGSGGVLVDGGAVAINIAAVNDQPHVTLPGAQSAVEDTSLDIHGLSVSDVDSDDGGELAVTLTVQHGTLGLTDTTGLTFTGGTAPGDASLTFTGTVDHVNAALATLAYQSDLDYNGADSLDVNVSDQGNTGSGGVLVDGGAVAINIAAVNDQPHVTLPGAQSAVEDTSLDIHGLSVSDVDSDDGGELAVTLTVQHGTLGLTDTTGLTFTGGTAPGDASLTFTGTVDHVNAALATLAYQGDLDYNGADSLDVNVSDQGNTGSGGVLVDGGAVAINIAAVNDTPVSHGIQDITVKEDTFASTINLFHAFDDVEDPDNQLHYEVIDVSNPGLFNNVVIDETDGRLVLRYASDAFGHTDVTVLVSDTEGATTTETFHVEVQPVNDAPVASSDFYTVHGDETLVSKSPGILANDTDIDSTDLSAIVLVQPQHGQLQMSPDGSFRFAPDPSFVGMDSFTYVATDGAAVSGRVRVFINVTAPISPVETGSGSHDTTPSSTTTDPHQNNATNQLSQLVLAELPPAILESDDSQLTHIRQRDSLSVDQSVNADSSLSLAASVAFHNESDDGTGLRLAGHTRYADEVVESAVIPLETTVTAQSMAATAIADTTPLWESLDSLNELLHDDGMFDRLVDVSAISLATGLTVGYVFWTVRAGYLLTSLIAQMPAWKLVDPLPILSSLDSDSESGDSESLESILQSGNGSVAETPVGS